jgi:hypothetical protein
VRGALRWPLRMTSTVVLLVALALAATAAWGVHAVVRGQEHRLLKERGAELNLLLTNSLQSITSGLELQGGVLRATDNSRTAFERAAAEAAAADPAKPSFAWLRPQGSGFVVVAAGGSALRPGSMISDQRVQTLNAALSAPGLVSTPILPPDRRLGLALGPPAAPAGTVLYREADLGPVQSPRTAGTAPYAELDVAIYAATTQLPNTVLVTTTKKLPLRGEVRIEPLVEGGVHWSIAARAKAPLVGNVAANAWWITFLVGAAGAILLAWVVEIARRRRDTAFALYAKEHELAETLQRSLLPDLPTLPGLDIAARYLAGGRGQEVGGDWFDVFPVRGGVAITVGDVVGHDLAAASAMAQLRASLRAYAVEGEAPKNVITRLSRLVEALDLTQLATVVYGVLSDPDPDGGRTFTYTNAGHPAPLLRLPSGEVEPLRGGESVLIGAPLPVERTQMERYLEHGCTLLLFTDGLVEVPDRPLDETIDELARTFADLGSTANVEMICERVLDGTAGRELRDDVAVLAIRIGTQTPLSAPASQLSSSA